MSDSIRGRRREQILRANPFVPLKADDLSPEDIKDWFERHGAISPALTKRHEVFIGGRGSGKTILLRYLSYSVQRILENAMPADGVRLPFGIYCDLRNLIHEIDGRIERSRFAVQGFTAYLVLFVLRHVVDLLLSAQADGALGQADVARILSEHEGQLGLAELPAHSANALREAISKRLERFFAEGHIAFRPESAPPTGILNSICRSIAASADGARSDTVLLLLDQYDELTAGEQSRANMLFRNGSPRGYRLKIGVRPRGWRSIAVAAGSPLRENQDYWRIDLEFRNLSEKRYDALLRGIARRRLSLWKAQNQEDEDLAQRVEDEDIGRILGSMHSEYREASSRIVQQYLMLCHRAFEIASENPEKRGRGKSLLARADARRAIAEVARAQYDTCLSAVEVDRAENTHGAAFNSGRLKGLLSKLSTSVSRLPGIEEDSKSSDLFLRIQDSGSLLEENRFAIDRGILESVFHEQELEQDSDPGSVDLTVNRLLALHKGRGSALTGVIVASAAEVNEWMEPFARRPSGVEGPSVEQLKFWQEEDEIPSNEDQSDAPGESSRQLGFRTSLLRLTAAPSRASHLDELTVATRQLGEATPERVIEYARYSVKALDDVRKGLPRRLDRFNENLRTELGNSTIVIGGSVGRLEATREFSDADFVLVVDSQVVKSGEIGRTVAAVFNETCDALSEVGLSVNENDRVSHHTTIEECEGRKFPKISRPSYFLDRMGSPDETDEAKTLRMVILTEGAPLLNDGVWQTLLNELLLKYQFGEYAASNQLPDLFIREFSHWIDKMWDRLSIRDVSGELAYRKFDCHRTFLKKSTLLAFGAHVLSHREEQFATLHELLVLPPALRLLHVLQRVPTARQSTVRPIVRDVLISYNDGMKILRHEDLRAYWLEPTAQLQLERKDQARFRRLTERLQEKLQEMNRAFERLAEEILPELPEGVGISLAPHLDGRA
jgi:hypothetical protein